MLFSLLLACDPYGVSVTATELATVLRVSWEGSADTVQWETDDKAGSVSGDGEALIVGPTENQLVRITVTGPDGDAPTVTAPTGLLPRGLPSFDVSVGDAAPTPMLMAVVGSPLSWTFVLDERGEIVWYAGLDEGSAATGVGVFDGTPLHNVQDTDRDDGAGSVHQHGWDGELLVAHETDLGHHFFLMHDDGRLAYLQADVRLVEDEGFVVGDSLRILDPDGESTLFWSAWDHFPWNPDDVIDTGFYPQGFDWTHANGLSYSEARDSYWMSFAVQSALIEVDATTGETLNHLGFGGDWTIEGDGFGLDVGPHCPSITPDGTLLIFDNQKPSDGTSRVLEYELDYGAKVATPIRELPSTVSADLMGCPTTLDSGETLTSWGSGGLLTVHDGEQLTWQADVEIGFSLGQVVPIALP